jgi:hypothetical protein
MPWSSVPHGRSWLLPQSWHFHWAIVSVIFTTGHCVQVPVQFHRIVVGSELLLLVVVGWIFYRREMKDDGF